MSDYAQSRYEFLREIVGEYLDDEGGASTKFIDDLHRALLENSQYFKGRVDQYNELLRFYQGGAQQ